MAGSLHHRLVRPALLPYGPVSIRLTPTGDLEVIVDDTQIDPMLAAAMDGVGGGLFDNMNPLDLPLITPQTIVEVHAVNDVGDGRLVAAEVDKGILRGIVDKDLVKPEILPIYSAHCTAILRRFTPPTL